jgi:L-threonylcarbamoyladenylate synthase
VARALIRISGVPIAAPSANLSGKPSPTTAKHVIEDMTGRIPMIIDGGDASVGLESTVISIVGDTIRLLRPGYVTLNDLKTVTDKVEVSSAVLSSLSADEKPESPGMKYRHYAPSAPVIMVYGKDENVLKFFREKYSEGCGILCFDEDLEFISPSSERVVSLGKQNDLYSQANRLFSSLRKFDEMNVKTIYARHTSSDELGLAISNRLLRACAFEKIEV